MLVITKPKRLIYIRPPKVSRALEASDDSQNQRKSTKKRKIIIKRMRKLY